MKQVLTFTECRQIPPHHRILLHQLYRPGESPCLLSPHPDYEIYAAWNNGIPIAAIEADYTHYKSDRLIRLAHAAYRDRHVFRSLLEHFFYNLNREHIQGVTISLKAQHDSDQDKIGIFKSLDFFPYHETFIYTLPLLPFDKEVFSEWTLELINTYRQSHWLAFRNCHAHVLPNLLPLSSLTLTDYEKRQHCFYFLKFNGHNLGTLRAHVRHDCLDIHELHIEGNEETLQEAVSFIQQTFYRCFKTVYQMRIILTSLQPELRYAVIKQGAYHVQPGTYIMIKDLHRPPL